MARWFIGVDDAFVDELRGRRCIHIFLKHGKGGEDDWVLGGKAQGFAEEPDCILNTR